MLFLGDILPTGWQAAANCDIEPTDPVAVWGAGPVGQFAVRSACLMGAKQVVCIDRLPDRLSMARAAGAITTDFDAESVRYRFAELTQGKGLRAFFRWRACTAGCSTRCRSVQR